VLVIRNDNRWSLGTAHYSVLNRPILQIEEGSYGWMARRRILFSFDTDFAGKGRPAVRFELGRGGLASLATSPVVLFVALPETESKSDPG
jgi:hypothetical protein